MIKSLIILCLTAGLLCAYNLPDPTLDSAGNLGPLTFYPDNPEDRLYKLPWDSGVARPVDDGAFNRPDSHHKGYSIDWRMPWGTPVLAARGGYVYFIGRLGGDGDNCIQIIHTDFDTIGHHTTVDFYLHVQVDSPVVAIPQKVEQGEVIAYTGQVGMFDHLHLEIQEMNHTGQGWKYDTIQPIESVPTPFVEITQRPDGIPWRGDVCVSQNKRYVPNRVEGAVTAARPVPLMIAPNPAADHVSISTHGKAGSATVFDMQGRSVAKVCFGADGPGPVLRCGHWPSGVYTVRVVLGKKTLVRRFLKVR